MKAGVVQSAFIANTTRLDGGFHLSEGITVRSLIAKSPYSLVKIGEVTESVYCPGIFHRNYVSSGTPFLGGADIQKMDYDTGKYLRESTTPNHEILAVKKDWTLVTCGGTIGETAYVNEDLAKCWLSQHIMRVIPNVSKIKEGFLYAYLASKQGKSLLTTNTYGSVIPTLNAGSIKQIPIPLFPAEFQNKIDVQIKEAAALRVEANKLLEEAKKKVEEYVGVEFKLRKEWKCCQVSFSDIWSSLQHRLDPPALINDSVVVFNTLKDKTIRLGNAKLKVYRPGIFKRSYVASGYAYIKGSELFDINPFSKCEHLSRTRTPFVNEMLLKDNQILVTCAGSCGQIKLITKEFEDNESIGSQDIIRIESEDELITSQYLFVYLKTRLVYDYIQSMKYGSVIERIEPFHVESIPVVKPTKELSEEVTALIDKYKDCTYKAYCLERSAIKAVEDEIDSWGK